MRKKVWLPFLWLPIRITYKSGFTDNDGPANFDINHYLDEKNIVFFMFSFSLVSLTGTKHGHGGCGQRAYL